MTPFECALPFLFVPSGNLSFHAIILPFLAALKVLSKDSFSVSIV